MNTKRALKVISDELKDDKEYREMWKANIAMAFKDCHSQYKSLYGVDNPSLEDIHIIASSASEYFIRLLSGDNKGRSSGADGMVALGLNLIEIIEDHKSEMEEQ